MRLCILVATFLFVCFLSTSAFCETHNAVEQFDDFNNPSPNGWSYRNHGEILRNFVFNWNEPDFGPEQAIIGFRPLIW